MKNLLLLMKRCGYALVLFLFIVISEKATAQFTCDFTYQGDTAKCGSLLILANATGNSSSPVVQRRWQLTGPVGFSTFTSSPGLNPNFSYSATLPGNYCLTLKVYTQNGDSCIVSKCNLFVYPLPVASFNFTNTEGCQPLLTTFNCTSNPGSGCEPMDSTYVDWGCGLINGYQGCPSGVVHSYANCPPGCYTPTIIVKNNCGCYATATYNCLIRVIPDPVASFTAAGQTVFNCAPGSQSVTFNANNTGPNMTYQWSVNGAVVQSDSLTAFTYTFPLNANCYDVMLVVVHASGGNCRDTLLRPGYVCVRPQPVISFTQNITTACINAQNPATLTLTNTSAGSPSVTWNLTGPGGAFPPQTGNVVNFNITALGNYSVTATGSFGPGCSATVTQQVLTAVDKPVACFSADDSIFCSAPDTVHYTSCPCTGCTYSWNFQGGSGSTSQLQNPTVVYNNYGQFNASLIVTATNGCATQISKGQYIKVRKINPAIGFNHSKGCAPVCATFTDLTNYSLVPDPIASACWSFPGSTVSGSCLPSFSRCFSNVGCYDVRLAVTTTTGCTDTTTLADTICVNAPPVCTVTATPLQMCFEADTVRFSLSCDSVDYFRVEYGDGIIEWLTTPSWEHIYQDTGFFHTSIIAYNDSCTGDTLYKDITIWPPITKFSDSTFCNTGDTVFLTNKSAGATSFLWSFACDGSTSAQPNIARVFPTCDSCEVTLTTFNSATGCTHHLTRTIATACDVASISPSYLEGCAPFQAVITNTSSHPSQPGVLTKWDWDCASGILFGPGGGNNTGNTAAHIYNNAGIYCFAMKNQSPSGCIDTVYGTVKVCDIIPDFAPLSVCLPLPLCFQNLTRDSICTQTRWEWFFGDGSTDTTFSPCHTYTTAASYQVKLRVSNDMGCVDSIIKTVVAGQPVNLNYHVDTNLCPGATTCVTNSSTGVSLSWDWDVPSAQPPFHSTSATPCFSFSQAGDYPVYLRIQSGTSCSVYDTIVLHNAAPVAGGYVSTNHLLCPYPPQIIVYYDTSRFADHVIWQFGDGSVSTFDTANNIYTQPGCYPITLIASNNFGCIDTVTVDTICVDGPYGTATFTPDSICAAKELVDYVVNSVSAKKVTLIHGCNTGYTIQDPVTPIGTPLNPTVTNFHIPYLITDTCHPQVVFEDQGGCQVPLDLPLLSIDSPTVKFNFNNYGVCINGTVCFEDATFYHAPGSVSYTVTRVWDFGDGSPLDFSNNPTPCHYYGQPGGYAAKLYITSNFGCIDSSVGSIVVVPEYPIAGFYSDDSLICAGSPLCFHDTSYIYPLTGADYWVYTWGDGTFDTVHTPTACHSYAAGGYYTVHMCVWDSVGCSDCADDLVVHAIDRPTANAGADPTICYGQVTTLDGSGGDTCHWFPQGLFADPNICNPTLVGYADTTLTLVVVNNYGCSDTDIVLFRVAGVTANFTAPATSCISDSVCMTDASTNFNGTLTEWHYWYGDGGFDTLAGPNPCHYYTSFGSQTITLTVYDNHGCSDDTSLAINILPSPQAAFSLNDSVICSNQQVCVTDLSTSVFPITGWSWNYGAGAVINAQAPPCHTYTPPFANTYNIALIVTDQNNCRDTAVIPLTVNEVPNAAFSWTTSCETDPMPLASTSTPGDGQIVNCEWLFWLGAANPVTDNNCNTSFLFPPGSYPVQLVVRDVNGCSDTIVRTVLSDSISQLVVYPGDTTICLGTSVNYTVQGVFDQITWTPNVWISDPNSATVTITPLANIGYIVSAVNGVCAAASDTFTIRTIQNVPIDVTANPTQVVLGQSSNLNATVAAQVDSIVWSPDGTLDCRTCPNPIAIPTQTTTYTATAFYGEDGTGCTSPASVTVEVLNACGNSVIFIPNTFTPNGDGLNDIFRIRGMAIGKIKTLRVFDRWGQLVFEARDRDPDADNWGWDGNDRDGKKLNAAVFVYTYEIECINREIVTGKGNVTLVR